MSSSSLLDLPPTAFCEPVNHPEAFINLPACTLDVTQIMEAIPHRYPFLLIDRIVGLEPGKRIRAIKNVTFNEPFFQGHFPGLPVMPGVLQIEALAQMGAVLVSEMLKNSAVDQNKIAVLAAVDGFRFKRMVKPGDQLILEGELLKFRSGIGKSTGRAFIGNELVLSGDLTFSLVDRGLLL